MDQFYDLGVSHVNLTGAGEVTTHKGWVELTIGLRERGIRYGLTTNLSHEYKDEEIDALASAGELIVSFDTHDAELHNKIRRRSELGVILNNLLLIKNRSSKTGNKPVTTNNCVVSFETLPGLELMAANASRYGIDRVALLYMIDTMRLEGAFQVRELKTPDGRIRHGVPEAIMAFRKMAKKCGVDVFISDIIADIEADAASGSEFSPRIGAEARVEDGPIGLGMTRLCVAPWRAVYVTNDRKVGPCCFLSDYLGPLAARPLSEAVRSPEMDSLRTALLSGNLDSSENPKARDVCAKCAIYQRVPVSELEALLGGPAPPKLSPFEQIISFADQLTPEQ